MIQQWPNHEQHALDIFLRVINILLLYMVARPVNQFPDTQSPQSLFGNIGIQDSRLWVQYCSAFVL